MYSDKQVSIGLYDFGSKFPTIIGDYLTKTNFRVSRLDKYVAGNNFDAFIVDGTRIDGFVFDVVRTIRSFSIAPIVIITDEENRTDKILYWELGADEVFLMPVGFREFTSRLRSLLRRSGTLPALLIDNNTVKFGPWTMDQISKELTHSTGSKLTLTKTEYRLLGVLLRSPNRVYSRGQLLDLANLDNVNSLTERAIDTYISRLRKKLERNGSYSDRSIIGTKRGFGYFLNVS